MTKKMPTIANSIEVLEAKKEAHDTVTGLIERNMELEEIFQNLQPLLYALSTKLYGEDDSPKSLGQIVEDGVHLLNGTTGETLQ